MIGTPSPALSGADGWRFSVSPAVHAGQPHIGAAMRGAAESLEVTISSLTDVTSTVLSRRTLPAATSHTITLPEVAADTYCDLTVTTAGAKGRPVFKWRTLLRPAGRSLISYEGRSEMLPPPDFDAYWDRARAELEKVPMDASVTRVPDKDTSTGLLHRVELATVGNTRIVCWYYVPRDALDSKGSSVRKYRAIQIMPGYGAEEPPLDRTSSGYVTLSVNPRSHGPSREFWKSPGEHMMHDITEPERYYYRLAFLDCVRAAQFLFNRPEVDPSRVATEGGSQGGLFAIATAALEPRIACVCSNVTAFSDYPDGMILGLIGHHGAFRQRLADAGAAATAIRKSLAYTDGANMASRVKCPVQINMGGQDPVCNFVCGIVTYNRLPQDTEKQFNVMPEAVHEVPQQMRDWNNDWYRTWLR